jgi:hypothetical protein
VISQPVDWEPISAIGYDEDSREMQIEWRGTRERVRYFRVPFEVYEGLLQATAGKRAYVALYVDPYYRSASCLPPVC